MNRGRWAAYLLVGAVAFSGAGATATDVPELPPLGNPSTHNQDGEDQSGADLNKASIIRTGPGLQARMQEILDNPPARVDARIDKLPHTILAVGTALEELFGDPSDPEAAGTALHGVATDLQGGWDDEFGRLLQPIAAQVADEVKVLAEPIVGRAERAGVDTTAERAALAFGARLAAGRDYHGAAGRYMTGFDLKERVKFDIEVFRQNIVSRFQNQTVGFAYSINRAGSHYWSDASGQARTNADGQTLHSEFKEQFVASVSKHIFGTALLRALQDENIDVDSAIGPWLPPSWTVHASASNLSFVDVFTHHSGFSGVASDWASLRTRMGQSFPSLPDAYDYENANYGLMRILIPRVIGLGAQLDQFEFFVPGIIPVLYSMVTMQYIEDTIMEPIGMSASLCAQTDPNDTRYYTFPDDGLAGRIEGNHVLTCGGVGVFVSSFELARFLAHLRYSQTLLSTESRKEQDAKFLGYTHPDSPAFSGRVGDFGVYHSHGGDWSSGNKDAHACVMKFPINVEASVVMNSPIGGSPSQCPSLRDAFDNAWVAA